MAESGNGSAAYRWAWFALACVVVALWCVLNRWHLHRCTEFTFAEEGFARDACYVLDRWSGRIEFRVVPTTNRPPPTTGQRSPSPPQDTLRKM